MNESNKTLTFLAVAAAACVVAYLSQPAPAEIDAAEEIGKQLTKEFAPEDARRLKITRFDEDEASLSNFEVAQVGRLWSIPSRGGYPADAEEQMAKAVDGVRGREIMDVASKTAEDHESYGVVDPASPKLQVGQTGVGTRVTLSDESGDPLVDLIVGRQVKDGEGLHYVRRADQDFVYVVDIDPADFSTNFENWIEDDLLKFNPWEIKQVTLNDYSAQIVLAGGGLGVEPDYRTRMTLRYDDTESEWHAVKLEKATNPRTGDYEAFELADNEQLDADTLTDLKNALDDLRIVDVARKPAGLSANLKAGEDFFADNEALLSLIDRGFAPMENKDLLSTSGEVVCTLGDGVEYVLRFGDPIRDDASSQSDETDESRGGINRYMFVMARFNKDLLEQPELEDLPDLPEGVDAENADEPQPEDDQEDQGEAQADDADQDAEDQESSDLQSDDAQTDESDSALSEETKALVAQRKEIEQRNQQKLDEYAAKIEQGEQKVATLNQRFGDWYYVVSEDVFSKISLSRGDVITEKEAGDDEASASEQEANPLGAPGSSIPGLPNLGAVDIAGGQEEDTQNNDAEPSETAQGGDQEPGVQEPGDEEPAREAEPAVEEQADPDREQADGDAQQDDPPAEDPADDASEE